MFQYRQVLVRLRAGDSERDIARSGLMGREKAAKVRMVAAERGWLAPAVELPDDATLASALGAPRLPSSCTSSAEPWRELVAQWLAAGVQGKAIHAALCRQHGFAGSVLIFGAAGVKMTWPDGYIQAPCSSAHRCELARHFDPDAYRPPEADVPQGPATRRLRVLCDSRTGPNSAPPQLGWWRLQAVQPPL